MIFSVGLGLVMLTWYFISRSSQTLPRFLVDKLVTPDPKLNQKIRDPENSLVVVQNFQDKELKNNMPDGAVDNAKANGRINMWTYKKPAPCVGCPGENGGPVFLNVTVFHVFFLVDCEKNLILQN